MIGERLKQRITELGLTQQRAADQLEISQSKRKEVRRLSGEMGME